MTTWNDVVGWQGFYQVSDSGDVRSCDRIVTRSDGTVQTRAARQMRPCLNSRGYLLVHLSAPGRHRSERVHRLVAIAFIPNPDGLPEVNHLDGIKTHNAVGNLEWTTPYGNRKHAWDTGLRTRDHLPVFSGEQNIMAKLTLNQVEEARRRHADGEIGVRRLAREYGVAKSTMRDVLLGRTWKPPPAPAA